MDKKIRRAVEVITEWLLTPKDEEHHGSAFDKVVPHLRLSDRDQKKAIMLAVTKLTNKGCVIRIEDGWPQAIALDDVLPALRAEIIKARKETSDAGIGFYISDEEAPSC